MSKRTVFTTITPLPPGITRQIVLDFLHDHLEMIDLNPLVKERHPIPTPPHAEPDEVTCRWFSLTDKISYLPGVNGDVTYTCAFNDLPNGLQTHCYAPAGLDIRDKWTVGGSLPGEPREPAELGLKVPSTGLYLREDVDMRCNVIMTGFVKKTLKKSHAALVERLKIKAEIAATAASSGTTGNVYTRGSRTGGGDWDVSPRSKPRVMPDVPVAAGQGQPYYWQNYQGNNYYLSTMDYSASRKSSTASGASANTDQSTSGSSTSSMWTSNTLAAISSVGRTSPSLTSTNRPSTGSSFGSGFGPQQQQKQQQQYQRPGSGQGEFEYGYVSQQPKQPRLVSPPLAASTAPTIPEIVPISARSNTSFSSSSYSSSVVSLSEPETPFLKSPPKSNWPLASSSVTPLPPPVPALPRQYQQQQKQDWPLKPAARITQTPPQLIQPYRPPSSNSSRSGTTTPSRASELATTAKPLPLPADDRLWQALGGSVPVASSSTPPSLTIGGAAAAVGTLPSQQQQATNNNNNNKQSTLLPMITNARSFDRNNNITTTGSGTSAGYRPSQQFRYGQYQQQQQQQQQHQHQQKEWKAYRPPTAASATATTTSNSSSSNPVSDLTSLSHPDYPHMSPYAAEGIVDGYFGDDGYDGKENGENREEKQNQFGGIGGAKVRSMKPQPPPLVIPLRVGGGGVWR